MQAIGRCTSPRQTSTITHWIGGYVDHRDSLDASAWNATVILQMHECKKTYLIYTELK
jgi:hypothetical protein